MSSTASLISDSSLVESHSQLPILISLGSLADFGSRNFADHNLSCVLPFFTVIIGVSALKASVGIVGVFDSDYERAFW